MDINEILNNPELLNQLKDKLGLSSKGKNKGDGKNGWMDAGELGMFKLSDSQIRNISKDLNKKAANKTAAEIENEIMRAYI